MRNLLLIGFVLLIVVPAFAVVTVTYGWEDGGTILGTKPHVRLACTNVGSPDPVYSGLQFAEVQRARCGHEAGLHRVDQGTRGRILGARRALRLRHDDRLTLRQDLGALQRQPDRRLPATVARPDPPTYTGGTGWTNRPQLHVDHGGRPHRPHDRVQMLTTHRRQRVGRRHRPSLHRTAPPHVPGARVAGRERHLVEHQGSLQVVQRTPDRSGSVSV